MTLARGRAVGAVWLAMAAACGGASDAAPDSEEYAGDGRSPPRDSSLSIPGIVDVTSESGLSFRHTNGAEGDKWMPETVGSGGGWLDYDGDGWLDIFLVNGRSWSDSGSARAALFRNQRDGTFADVSRETGADISVYGMGAAFGDFDGDGDADIYVTAVGDNILLRNDGGRFEDVTGILGVDGNPQDRGQAWSTGAAWLDHDRDGDLDLFVCNYVRWTPETDLFHTLDGTSKAYATPEAYEGDTCVLYRNEDGVRFSDATRAAGLWNQTGKALGIIVDDFNSDGWPDLVVTNDTEPNFFYVNRGDGTFEDRAVRAGVAFDPTGRARAGMGVDVTDLDGDGRLTVTIGNFSREAVSLYSQLATELFRDRAPELGLARPTLLPLTFGLRYSDVNLDGWEDLVLANGHIEPTISDVRSEITFAQPPQLFVRSAEGFIDAGDATGADFGQPLVGRGLAVGDYDRDGDADLLITVNGDAARLYRVDAPESAGWVGVRLTGPDGNRRGIGAVVHVYASDHRQRWYVTGSGSYLAQSETGRRSFGLGSLAAADSVRVTWPDGRGSFMPGPVPAGTEVVFNHADSERPDE
ncbi:MAG: CRTAC1 family protein [Gemmatimonadota bacterium]